jgi:ATPase subunit of ABC transporter with duplicated ATPase domains
VLSTEDITMQFGAKPLFEKISVKFTDGNRYGLIGANGAGKSTFMKILGGDLDPSGGRVSLQPGLRLGKLRQNQFAYEGERVLDVVMMGHDAMWQARSERDAIYANAEATDDDYMRAAELEAKFAEYDGYTAEARAGELLLGVGIDESLHEGPMSAVAPGWKLRVLLAQALFSNPDVLLLDEPTNNLDINTIRWLEEVLNARSSTMVIISHDRHFLNSVCTHMADLDYGTIKVYPGNYDDYMLASTQARAQLAAANARAKEKVAELQEFVRRFSANKSKARQATSRQKQIEKIRIEDIKPSSRQYPYIRFEVDPKEVIRRVAIHATGLVRGYERPLFGPFDLVIEPGERVAIIGPNGIGKTTLLRALAGLDDPELGLRKGAVALAEKAHLGYCAQEHAAELDADMTLVEWVSQWKTAEEDDQIVRATLGRLLFTGDDGAKSVRVLSGGEQQRIVFGRLTLEHPNVLLMDEPTNHLDMESIESLDTALARYEGTLVLVSHDRQFVSSVATRILELRPGPTPESPATLVDFTGSYDDYLTSQGITT